MSKGTTILLLILIAIGFSFAIFYNPDMPDSEKDEPYNYQYHPNSFIKMVNLIRIIVFIISMFMLGLLASLAVIRHIEA